MRKFWDKFVKLLYKVGQDKWFHFIAGMIVAAVLAFATGWAWSALIAAAVAGVAKEVFDIVTTKVYDVKDVVATICGGFIIFLCAML